MRYTLILSLLSATIFALEQQVPSLVEENSRIEAETAQKGGGGRSGGGGGRYVANPLKKKYPP
jgi:hypothetical protein